MFNLLRSFNFILIVVYCNGWSPVGNRIKTRWASTVDPNKVWPEYPRPQLIRENNWLILNGLWNYSITDIGISEQPTKYDGEILVPFPVESPMSGVQKDVNANQTLWYHKSFIAPKYNAQELIILHFGAVDYHTNLYINGKPVGEHIGGYDSFSFDITKYITTSNEQTIVLRVTDLKGGSQPTGWQRRNPNGILDSDCISKLLKYILCIGLGYTPTTGIWQTVWLEKLPKHYITNIIITSNIDRDSVELVINTNMPNDHIHTAEIKIIDSNMIVVAANGNYSINTAGNKLKIPNPILWSTTNPYLYTLQIKFETDTIASYFGMRKIEVKKDSNGINRFFLNNNPIFMFGTLDKGFWPEGIYLASSDEALKYDLIVFKQFGFNSIRKQMKVEPERWYYWTDKMGILVWQDFPSAFGNLIEGNPEPKRTASDAKQIETEMKRMVTHLYNHPSIVVWALFSEGWGQYDTPRIVNLFRSWDQSRLINEASNNNDRNASNILERYQRPNPQSIPLDSHRVTVIGDYGGAWLKINNHLWDPNDYLTYQTVHNKAELQKFFIDRLATIRALAIFGLGAAFYTQSTDIDAECSGLITYDREVIKVDSVTDVKEYVDKLYPYQSLSSIILKSGHMDANQEWHYITANPSDNWQQTTYSTFGWSIGKAGFGTYGTPAVTIHTDWNSDDIWLRKEFYIKAGLLPKHPVLIIFYDDFAEVYINGVEILGNFLNPWQRGYAAFDINKILIKEGKNVIAIHCHNYGGGQGIDAGIIDIDTGLVSTYDTSLPSQIGFNKVIIVGIPVGIVTVILISAIISILIHCYRKRNKNEDVYYYDNVEPTNEYEAIDYNKVRYHVSDKNNAYLDIH